MCHGLPINRLDWRVKSICFLNVVINQEILINTHKTKQATSCCVTRNRVPCITCYCVFIHVRIDIIYTGKNMPYIERHRQWHAKILKSWQNVLIYNTDSLKIISKKKECFTDFCIAMPPRTSVSKDVGDSGIRRMNSTLLATRNLCLNVPAKAGMVHSVSGWMRSVQVKLWDPLRMRAIPECLRCVLMMRRYTNPRLTLPLPLPTTDLSHDVLCSVAVTSHQVHVLIGSTCHRAPSCK